MLGWSFTGLTAPVLVTALVSCTILWNCASRDRVLESHVKARRRKRKLSKERKHSKEARMSKEEVKTAEGEESLVGRKFKANEKPHQVPPAYSKSEETQNGDPRTAKPIDFLYPTDSNENMWQDESTLRHVSSIEPDNETSMMIRSHIHRHRDTELTMT
ncbi:unnamed protein product [Bursaphelenchus okinawaensis]|uniref:Uncharacterized protein n=1 Tax=Bursaphelenchus okinawaensis TaxID=465554 RepID=A0A811LIN9_9BILA|nr:unnamed protein product [Bursaphelenchus okinawaensis]CAG9126698.1 unnamed protein product [Bursaphelenchus okinawaensis]